MGDPDYNTNEECTIIELSKRFTQASNLAPIAKCVTLSNALQLLPGIDSNPDNLVLAGQFDGSDRSFIALCRVEIGSGAFKGKCRIAVRSSHVKLSPGLSRVIALAIGGGRNEAA